VVDKVLRASSIPVLLIRAAIHDEVDYKSPSIKTIIVPLDGSELAEQVLPHVRTFSYAWRDQLMEIVLLTVCEVPMSTTEYFSYVPLNISEYIEGCKQEGQQYLDRVEGKLKGNGIKVRSQVLVGRVADEIADFAGGKSSNLVIMATHGRSGPGRWVLGSIAEKVIRGTSNPLLLIRAPLKTESKT